MEDLERLLHEPLDDATAHKVKVKVRDRNCNYIHDEDNSYYIKTIERLAHEVKAWVDGEQKTYITDERLLKLLKLVWQGQGLIEKHKV